MGKALDDYAKKLWQKIFEEAMEFCVAEKRWTIAHKEKVYSDFSGEFAEIILKVALEEIKESMYLFTGYGK